MKEFIKNTIKDLKSLITVLVTVAFIVWYFMGLVEPKDFFFIVGMVFTFYFTKKDTLSTPTESNTTTTTITNSSINREPSSSNVL